MSVCTRSDGKVYCRWRDEEGNSKAKYFGRGEVAVARARVFDESMALPDRRRRCVGLSVAEVCQEYHLGHVVQVSTSRMDRYKFVRLITELGGYSAETLDGGDLNRYVQTRNAAGVKRSTIVRELGLLKAVMAWAAESKLIGFNGISGYHVPRMNDSEVLVPPAIEEVRRLVDAAEPHLRRAIMISWYCGVRPGSELLSIRWRDVHLERRILHVQSARKGGPVVRQIPIPAALLLQLCEWHDSDAKYVRSEELGAVPVVHYRFQAVTSLKRAWATAKRRAGITRKLRPYDLRHAMITEALAGGADLKAVSEIAGHSRPDTTLRVYQHVAREQHHEAVAKISEL